MPHCASLRCGAGESAAGSSTLRLNAAPSQTRKPYTITKQRERWTDAEHQRFLEALKLHGRKWPLVAGKLLRRVWGCPGPGISAPFLRQKCR